MAKPGHDGVALDRRRDGEERGHRPGPEPARGVLLGPRAELADARLRDDRGDEEARPDGGASIRIPRRARRCSPRCARTAPTCCRSATQFETEGSVTASNRSLQWREKRDRAAVRVAHRPHDHVPARAEARLRRPVHRQEGRQAEPAPGQGQGRHGRAVDGRHRCGTRSTPAAGPSATPASRPSGCRRTCATCTSST